MRQINNVVGSCRNMSTKMWGIGFFVLFLIFFCYSSYQQVSAAKLTPCSNHYCLGSSVPAVISAQKTHNIWQGLQLFSR